MTKRALNLYLDKKLIDKIEKDIAPFKISNFVTKLFQDYLENKNAV